MAVDFDKTILLVDSVPDNILILFIFKSLELGTLNFDSAITTLGINGISLQINRACRNLSNNSNNSNPSNNSTNNNISNNNDSSTSISNDVIDDDSTSPYIEIPAIDNININKNNTSKFKFGDFSSRGNQIWSTNYAKVKQSYLNGATDVLKKKYKDFIGNNQLKNLPKEISNLKRAKDHFEKIFVPQLVCFFYYTTFFSINSCSYLCLFF
jgi:hypothetical protein